MAVIDNFDDGLKLPSAEQFLTMEQKFKLTLLDRDIERLSLPQAKELVRDLLIQSMIKDNQFKQVVRNL